MSSKQDSSTSIQLPLFDPVTITLTQGYNAIVDPIDADLAEMLWCAAITRGKVYAMRERGSDTLYMHRLVLSRILNRPLETREKTDHIDGNGLNNLRNNLRLASHTQNLQNSKRRTNNKSGFKGVFYSSGTRKKWCAKISVNKHHIVLGYFDTPEEAHEAYCLAARRHFGEFARFE